VTLSEFGEVGVDDALIKTRNANVSLSFMGKLKIVAKYHCLLI
jgi:hypothetical protein